MRSVLLSLMGVVSICEALIAQTDSGPKAGDKVEPLKVHVATGDDAGKEKDVAAQQAKKTAVFVFVQAEKWDRPMARFLRTLDEELGKNHADVAVAAVWLTDDVDKSKDYLPNAQKSLKLTQTTFAVHPGDKAGPKGWGINPDAHLTAVVTRSGKVIASFGFVSINETDVPAVVKKLPGKK